MSGDDVPPGFVRLPLTGAIVPIVHSSGTTLTGALAPGWRRKAERHIGTPGKAAPSQTRERADAKKTGNQVELPSEGRRLNQMIGLLISLEALRPKTAPFRSPEDALGRAENDFLAYADVLIAHVRAAKFLSSTERDYLGQVADVINRRSSSKAERLRNALAFADIASRIKASASEVQSHRVAVPQPAPPSAPVPTKGANHVTARAPEAVQAYSEIARTSLIQYFTQLEACRPKANPFRAPREAVGRSLSDLIAYADALIAHIGTAGTLSASERNYLGLIARLLDRQSSLKAEELRKALAVADLMFSRSVATPARSTAQPVTTVPVKTLNWEVLPQGKWDFGTVRAHFRTLSRRRTDLQWDISRLKTAESLRPVECWIGQDEFDGYVVYVFRGGKMALLDHPLKGNACYILRGDWRALARLSKYELLTEYQKRVTRIVHRGDWKHRLRRLFSAARRKR